MSLKATLLAATLAAVLASPALAQTHGAPGSFSALDRTKDDYLSRDEVRDMPWSNRFSEMDKDNDGRLSLGEFDAMQQQGAATGATAADKDKSSPNTDKPAPKQ